MEKSVYEKISQIWDKCKKGDKSCPKVVPSVYYAKNENEDIYYVVKDFSTIVYLVYMYENKPHTYVIPKKYLKVEIEEEDMKYYFITKPSKLNIVSCSNNQIDEFDTFVVKNIISKIKLK
tara:strand:- start:552 stop:911 length:360 start_codon:yes stop_codon:yes gene_type:complete